MVTTWARTRPLSRTRATLLNVLRTLKPLLHQLVLSSYIFAFQLPAAMINYAFYARDFSILKSVHREEYGGSRYSTSAEAADCLASSVGPSGRECKTSTRTGEDYPPAVYSNRFSRFADRTAYYRDGPTSVSRWEKSLETIAGLYRLRHGSEFRRTSSGAGLFDEGPKGFLRASSTIVWGKRDFALHAAICLDGIADYLVDNSQVVLLNQSGHFTPLDHEGQKVLTAIAIWSVKEDDKIEDIRSVVECYPGAVVSVSK